MAVLGELIPCLGLLGADALASSMIAHERAGSARHTAMNACASSVSLNWCGGASVTRVTASPEKSYSAAPVLASPFANLAFNRSVSFNINPLALSPRVFSRG